MGTDIHPAIEIRRKGIWRFHRPKTPCKWYFETWDDQTQVDEVNERMNSKTWTPVKVGDRRNGWDRCKTRLPECFTSRNYLKFAILGNVRNGYGFAGVKTFDPVDPISDQRGFPIDITDEARAKMSNEHSETWLTLQELLDYNWDRSIVENGVITEAQYLRCLIEKTTPESWSGGISGPQIEVLNPEGYLALFGKNTPWGGIELGTRTYDAKTRYYINYTWDVPLRDGVPDIAKMIVYLTGLVPKNGTPDDVRVVMDFDS